MTLFTLDSSSVPNQDPHDFTIEFGNPIYVREGIHEIALVKSNLWYSFYNISSSYNNNTFQYTNNSAQTRTVTIPNGNYTIIQINEYLHYTMKLNGDYTVVSGVDTFDINITPNYSTLKVTISLSNTYSIDLTTSDFNDLLGWDQGVYNFSGSQDGQNTANINRNVNSLLIHCDIVSRSFKNNVQSDILYSFVPKVPPGSNIEVTPTPQLIYLPIRIPDFITRIRMYITDQLNRTVDFNGEPITYLLHLRKQFNLYNPTITNI